MCNKCDGSGWITYYDSVPYGSTNVSMPTVEMCDCLESNECPKCGEPLVESSCKSLYGHTMTTLTCECGFRTEY